MIKQKINKIMKIQIIQKIYKTIKIHKTHKIKKKIFENKKILKIIRLWKINRFLNFEIKSMPVFIALTLGSLHSFSPASFVTQLVWIPVSWLLSSQK